MLGKLPIIPFAELLAKGFSFIIMILLTRLLSIEEYGVFNYIVSLVLLMSVVMDGGINNFVFNKSLQNNIESINIYFNARFFLSLIIIGIFSVSLFVLKVNHLFDIALYSFFVFLNSTLSFFKMLARGRGLKKIDLQNILFDPFFRLILLSILFFVGSKYSLQELLISFAIVEIALFIYSFLQIKKYIYLNIIFSNMLLNIKNVVVESKHFLLYYFFFVMIQRMDVIMISNYINPKSVALFSSAYNLYMVIILFFSSWITSSLFKSISNRSKFFQLLIFTLIIYFIIAIFLFFTIDIIYTYIYPNEYLAGSSYLKYFLIGLPFMIFTYLSIYSLNYINKQKINMIVFITISTLKLSSLLLLASNQLIVYIYVMVTFEIIMGIIYMIIFYQNRRLFFENTTNK